MSVFTPLLIIIMVMSMPLLLQLPSGIFTIFYHSALAQNSRRKADDLALDYIFGVELFLAIFFMSVMFITTSILSVLDLSPIFFFILSGVFFAEAFAAFKFYFRKSAATALFLPRRIAENYRLHAEKSKSRLDAVALGLFSGVPELLFSFPLFIAASLAAAFLPPLSGALIIIIYIIVALIPLFSFRTLFRRDYNLARITRLRIKLKPYVRALMAVIYLIIAILFIILGVTYGR